MSTVHVRELIEFLEGLGQHPTLDGGAGELVGFCSLSKARSGCLTWAKKVSAVTDELPACVVVGPRDMILRDARGAASVIAVEEPKRAFFGALRHFWGREESSGIASTAVVLGTIGKDVYVGEHSYIGPDVSVGNGTRIMHNVTICCPASIGKDCRIGAGSVIGTDGFGYYFEEGIPKKVEHYGGVRIGDRVEIGSNTCVDRGTIDDTVIEDDVKIDNLVHIAHNVELGRGSMVVAGAVVCGSAKLGQEAYVAPGGIVRNQAHIGAGALVGLGAVATRDVSEGMVAVGLPAKETRHVRNGDK